MAFDASALLKARAKKRKKNPMASSAVDPSKPPTTGFGGPKDGRRPATASVSSGTVGNFGRNASSPMGRLRGAKGQTTLGQRAARKKDPAAQIRRAARKALGIGDVRTADPATMRRLKAKGLLPGKDEKNKRTQRSMAAALRSGIRPGPRVTGARPQDVRAAVLAARKARGKKKARRRPTGGGGGGSD